MLAAGGEQGAKETPVIEIGRRRQRQERVGGSGTHRREVRKVDREEPRREERRIEVGHEVDSGDLAVDGDRERAAGGGHGGIVADGGGPAQGSGAAGSAGPRSGTKWTPAIWLSTVTANGPPAGSTAASSPMDGAPIRGAASRA